MRCLFSVEFPFFFRMIHVRYECRTSQSHLGKDVDFFRYHKTKSVYSRRLRRTRKRRNAENSFYQFHRPMTTEYMMNSYWTISTQPETALYQFTNIMQSAWPKQVFLLLWNWEKNLEWKTIRFGGKLEAKSSGQLSSSTLQTSLPEFRQLTWKMKLLVVESELLELHKKIKQTHN